jgi:hypothetical protein
MCTVLLPPGVSLIAEKNNNKVNNNNNDNNMLYTAKTAASVHLQDFTIRSRVYARDC